MRILLIGGSGLLGQELLKLNRDIIAPSHEELDITNPDLYKYKADIVINAAAIKDNRSIELHPLSAVHTNIIGAALVSSHCYCMNLRYIYISTDYIYKGEHGNYKEDNEILPANIYAWTKLGGECSARTVKNHLIIRTTFGPAKFEYRQAFTDKWTSKDYVDVIAPMILEAALSPLTGVLNIGTERKTLYHHALKRNQVCGVRLADTSFRTPYDTSFNLQKWMDYKSLSPTAKTHTSCRVCQSKRLVKYLDLGLMPLANNLEFTALRAKEQDRFPLQVMLCQDCGLSQLSVVIDPVKMYSYYTYRSGINAPYVEHCNKMASALADKYNLDHNSFHIDIAGNDGTLLAQFKKRLNNIVLNVDPASNLTAISEAIGVPTKNKFWDSAVALEILEEYSGADLITATNVFAHVNDIIEFLSACKESLKLNGILLIECPYVIDFVENMEFDTTYFEHLSYMSITPLNKLCCEIGLKILSVEKFGIHGGTVRIIIANELSNHSVEPSVMQFIQNELDKGFNDIKTYKNWSIDVANLIQNFSTELMKLKKQGFKIACFAASAKGNTLLNACSISTEIIDYIVDQTPEKVGKFSPGTGIPIVNMQEFVKNPPDYVIILSWNFAAVIIPKIKELCDAKIIIPIPEFKIIDHE